MKLKEFREAYSQDDNEWWKLDSGYMQNLFDEACEEIDRLEAENKELKKEHGVLFNADMELIGKLKIENKELKAKQFDREKALELLNTMYFMCEYDDADAAYQKLRKMLEGK